MGKGNTFPCEATRLKDLTSGRTVWQLTTRQGVNHGPYFYNPPCTRDGRQIVFGSDRCGGDTEQLFLLEWPSGSIIQLTNGKRISAHNAVMAPRGAAVYYFDDGELKALSLQSFKERTLARIPEGLSLCSNLSISSDGQLVVFCAFRRPDTHGRSGWDVFDDIFEARPHTEIWVAPIDGSGGRLVHTEERWLGHPQFRPGDKSAITFCREGPWHKVERIWAVRADGSGETRCLRPQELGRECIGHEYWTQDGSTLVYAYHTVGPDGVETEGHSVRCLELVTGTERVVFEGHRVNHFTSNGENTLIVADTNDPEDPFLYLIDTSSGTAEILCECGSTQRTYRSTQDAHPHPCFSWDGRYVFFNSDQMGWPNFYMVVV
ncbi:MAG: oligogalacturonate lyase family protein [Planctomycetota bacterium]